MLVLNTSEPVQEYELPLLTRSGLSEHLTAVKYHNIKPLPARQGPGPSLRVKLTAAALDC